MKLDQLIVQHLYNSKSVTLQGIGTIHLDPNVSLPQEADKNSTVPDNAFSFDYNLKAGEDEALIDFIVQQTRKIRPLASADLESFSILGKQFLNIGKPLTIEGIGTILKNQAGVYEFTPGNFIAPKVEEAPKQLKEKQEGTTTTISFENEKPKKDNSKGMLLFAFFVLIIALAAMGLYYFFFKDKPVPTNTVTTEQAIPALPDTTVKADTSKIDSTVNVQPAAPVVKDSTSFKVVIREYITEAAATKAQGKFGSYGYKDLVVIKVDSTKYRLALPFTAPLTDTVRVRDSIRRIFLGKPYIITQ